MWVEIVFWLLVIPLIVILFIIYFKGRKLYRLMYILSIFTYSMTTMYAIDAYDLGRNAVLTLLTLSAVLMMLMGSYFHKTTVSKKKKPNTRKNLFYALLSIALLALITLLSAIPFGFSKEEQIIHAVPESQITPLLDATKTPQYGQTPGPVLYTLTLTNTFLPRQYVLPRAFACLYNTKQQYGIGINTRWQISLLETSTTDIGGRSEQHVVQLGRETRTVELRADSFVRWKHPPEARPSIPPVPASVDYPEGFDTVYLFLFDKDHQKYVACENLQPLDLRHAKKIMIG